MRLGIPHGNSVNVLRVTDKSSRIRDENTINVRLRYRNGNTIIISHPTLSDSVRGGGENNREASVLRIPGDSVLTGGSEIALDAHISSQRLPQNIMGVIQVSQDTILGFFIDWTSPD